MFNVELSSSSHGGYAVVALCGELDLADAPVARSQGLEGGAPARRLLGVSRRGTGELREAGATTFGGS